MDASPKITRIIEIRDTRDYEVIEGRYGREYGRPIPGSGLEHECDRCGRFHEVWVTVELTDGTQRVLGTGCAAMIDPERAGYFRQADAAAKRLRKLRLELADLLRRQARAEVIWREVQQLEVPPVEESPVDPVTRRRTFTIDGHVEYRFDPTHPDSSPAWNEKALRSDRESVVAHWRDARYRERLGPELLSWSMIEAIETRRRAIKRAEASIAAFDNPKPPKARR